MNYECLVDPTAGIWATCTIIDNQTSPTHMFVRAETEGGPAHFWILNDRVRTINNSGTEPSH